VATALNMRAHRRSRPSRWQDSRQYTDLLWISDDDLTAPLIVADQPSDFHLASLDLTQIAELVAVFREYDARKWTFSVVGAEIEKCMSGAGGVNPQDASRYAGLLAYQRLGIGKKHARPRNKTSRVVGGM